MVRTLPIYSQSLPTGGGKKFPINEFKFLPNLSILSSNSDISLLKPSVLYIRVALWAWHTSVILRFPNPVPCESRASFQYSSLNTLISISWLTCSFCWTFSDFLRNLTKMLSLWSCTYKELFHLPSDSIASWWILAGNHTPLEFWKDYRAMTCTVYFLLGLCGGRGPCLGLSGVGPFHPWPLQSLRDCTLPLFPWITADFGVRVSRAEFWVPKWQQSTV